MQGVGTILVVDGSETARETLRTLLIPHCHRVATAAGAAEAANLLRRDDAIGLVLCDAVLPGGGAFAVLEQARAMPGRQPAVVLISPWFIPSDAERADAAGATGYLVRPLSLRDVARLWKQVRTRNELLTPRMERRPLAKVWLADPTDPRRYLMSWDLYDVSLSGAFIETRGPLLLGTELRLEIIFGKAVIPVCAEVVRVQEPSWMHVGGVGVRFLDLDTDSQKLLEAFVNQSVVVGG
jgi:CheY-like chemotaxis protein